MAPRPEAREKIDAFGLDAICAAISEGTTLTAISQEIGVAVGSLLTWIDADAERSARVREARVVTAKLWDEMATQCIQNAPDEFELKRAKELAHHYRWRASKIAPKEYGDRLELDGKVNMPLVIVKDLTGRDDEPGDD